MKINTYLSDLDFISSINYHNKEYIQELFTAIKKFLHKLPIPIKSFFDEIKLEVVFELGRDFKTNLKINSDISPHDSISLLELELEQFFPRFKILGDKIELPYKSDEIARLIKETGISFDSAFNMKKTAQFMEEGIIKRVWLMDDVFKFQHTVNGEIKEKSIRMATIPLSSFLKEFKLKDDHIERKSFIFNCSKLIREYNPQRIEISYYGERLKNFFKIQSKIMPNKFIYKLTTDVYTWGKFVFKLPEDDESMAIIKDKIKTNIELVDLGSM